VYPVDGWMRHQTPLPLDPRSRVYDRPWVKTTYDVARELARLHRDEDPDTQEVYFFEAPGEVRLLEISGSVGYTGELLPFKFGARPDKGIDYPSVVILLTPEELEDLREGRLALPDGWGALDTSRRVEF